MKFNRKKILIDSDPIKIYLLWIVILLTVTYLGFLLFPKSEYSSDNFFENFVNWDSRYYISIAQSGYLKPTHYAFFPGYPLAIKIITFITRDFWLSAILISVVSTFLASLFLYKLIILDFSKEIAKRTLFYLLFFPTSFYFLMGYSEGLFLLLSILTIYYFRKNKFFWATLFAILTSLTRFIGLILIFSIFIEILWHKRFNKKNIILLLSPLGFLLYCLYLYTQTGQPLYFIEAQTEWSRQIGLPWMPFWEALNNIFQSGFTQKYYYVIFDLVFAVFGLGMAIRSFRFLPPIYSFYALGSVLVPILTTNLSSTSRLLLPIFPISILLALIKSQTFKIPYLIISLILTLLFSALFLNWYWVA
ncbi:hypothetical protein A3B45_02250 [Candidatus Daviesbacteria bacterium RIFCSPLOWO2_01_FULL_39_12]|uniref:Glycosyltransferase RgtA/B/C/D-like domain-containing protein n=1 Tax=Candidatus Daviesbacteria bacterium RIFCSPLOWO2_01_FULL_39_12 TaxID=1797785 RepID=A0A1F5KNE7_9BACT|nr:MAG: hypothetical protein A3D79_02025 [Candidatus Daviesbacteria bacterium RIFCSPHIGHO2_02_FULL_39_8]OGE42453.1 MAG: hypothetical protein A3B45_02250 [Candidatus Daviesbacteria bacterium RIFCSPLOWO2_01_FULL_39_12]